MSDQLELPTTMRAAALDSFGGPDRMMVQRVPVPELGPHDVLIRLEVAGVGAWDPYEREGGYAEMLGIDPHFPYVIGSEGAGTVAAAGNDVDGFTQGDRVYAVGFLNPTGGFYAEFAVVDADLVSHIPDRLSTEQAGAMAGVALTALRGLDDTLHLKPGESLAVVGASGGIGHVAVQLAKGMGARVLAVASGPDGVALADRLGADASVDGRASDVVGAIRAFAPGGVDAVLLAAGGDAAERIVSTVPAGGRVAYPTGVHPEPEGRSGVAMRNYDGEPDREIVGRLRDVIGTRPFEVHVSRTFGLDQVADAHRALGEHHLGKLALRVSNESTV